MAGFIHPTAHIGPHCVVGSNVTLHEGVRLMSHVVVDGDTHIGAHTVVHPFAVLGSPPQDKKYRGEPTQLRIGARNTIREHVTMNTGTAGGGGLTQVGDDGLYMVGVHIGHDCMVGNNVILANNATLAGHVQVGDDAVLGGLSAVHQFCRIGQGAMIGGLSGVEHDVMPYGLVTGNRATLKGLNLVGLQRAGIAKEHIHALRALYKHLFGAASTDTLQQRVQSAPHSDLPHAQIILQFIENISPRGLTMPA